MIYSIIITILLLASLVANWNLLKKDELYEDWVDETRRQIETAINNMERIDESGMFKSDDEVGEVFDALVKAVTELRILEYDE